MSVPSQAASPKVDHVIWIVGESESVGHVSAFGYARKTTPFFEEMQKRSDVLLQPVHSAGLMTAVALPSLLNAVARPNGVSHIMKGNSNLIRLAKEQGFATHWYTAQASNEMNILGLLGAKWIDHTSFPDNFGYKSVESMLDENLLEKFDKVDFKKAKQFVVLHQRGSHSPYGSLLPQEKADRFGTRVLDRYDATILQTDQFIRSVYKRIHDSGLKNWLLVYTSDHGANVSEKTFNQGTVAYDSYTVPLFVTSDNADVMCDVRQVFSGCSVGFHQQLATWLIHILGYDMPVAGCQKGVVNGNLLSGDNGWLEIENNQAKYVIPR